MNRTPPTDVRRQLSREVSFGCPVTACASPYLTWHHFDPPWEIGQHHDPTGMIALCREHHDKADAGAFTKDQLRAMKSNKHSGLLAARFDWMRHELLAVVGGNFYFETLVIVQLRDDPVVWLGRDPTVGLMLNVNMPTASGRPRMAILDNWWLTTGEDEAQIECPPSGRIVAARYPNGDELRVEFQEFTTSESFDRRYPPAHTSTLPVIAPNAPLEIRELVEGQQEATADRVGNHSDSLLEVGGNFPVTTVEVHMRLADTDISFGPRMTELGGIRMVDCWASHCGAGIHIG